MRSLVLTFVLFPLVASTSFAQSGGGLFSEKEMESINRGMREKEAAEQKRLDQLKKSGALKESQSGVVRKIEAPRYVPDEAMQSPQRSEANVPSLDVHARPSRVAEPTRCADLRAQMETANAKYDARRSIVDAHADRSKFKMLAREYETLCGAPERHSEGPSGTRKSSITEARVRCSDGTYAASVSACNTDARTGKVKTLCPDGSYVAGVCTKAPGGRYYGK